jgi:hypothetical protein
MLRYGIRLSVAVATFLFSLLIAAVPTPSPSGGSVSVFEREVLEANRAYLEAHMNGDAAALERVLAEEFTVGGRYGTTRSKRERLAMVADAELEFHYTDRVEPHVSAGQYDGEVSGVAVVHGSHSGRNFTSPPYAYMRRFEKRDGRWQVVRVEIFRIGWR